MKRHAAALTIVVMLVGLLLQPSAGAAEDCFGKNPTILGTAGDDVLTGTEGPDVILGRLGNDEIHGRGGNDRICGGWGVDEVFGEEGDDKVTGDGKAERVSGGPGNDAVHGGDGRDWLEGGPGDDVLNGNLPGGLYGDVATYENAAGPIAAEMAWIGTASGEGEDTLLNIGVIIGSSYGDHVTVGHLAEDGHYHLGKARVFGRDGDDILDARGATGGVVLDSGGGNDTMYGSEFTDQLGSSDGSDTAYGNGGNDPDDEWYPHDLFFFNCGVGAENNCTITIYGSDDSDRVSVDGGSAVIRTFAGDDRINVEDGAGDDWVAAGRGADSCHWDEGDAVRSCTRPSSP